MITLAIVSPCYNEEEVISHSVERLTQLFNELTARKIISPKSCIVLVNDGSKDRTWQLICEAQQRNNRVRGINLTNNVGHQNAIMAGMMTAKEWADAVITMDIDLQDDLNAIPEMIALHEEGKDVVYGVKTCRKADPLLKRYSAMAFYRLQQAMGVKSVFNHADFRLMSKRALNLLSQYGERNLYLRGIIPQMGLPSATVQDVISEREAGSSKYTISKMLGLALDGITSFSVKPIHLIIYMGMFSILLSLLCALYVLYSYIHHNAVPGWSSLMLSLWFLGGCVLLSIGVIGIYVGKIYIEVKNRPLYNISEMIGGQPSPAPSEEGKNQ